MGSDAIQNSILFLPPSDRPREKLCLHGEEVCSDEELLAVILGTGYRGASALDLARGLLLKSGGLQRLQWMKAGEIQALSELGQGKSACVAAAFAVSRRASAVRWKPGEALYSSRQVFQRYQSLFSGFQKERFYALLLDSKNRLIFEEQVSEGTLTSSLVHPREVFGPALRQGAASMIVLHNHPSGDPTPSAEDEEVTVRLKKVGEMLGVQLLDHIVIGRDLYYSFHEKNKL